MNKKLSKFICAKYVQRYAQKIDAQAALVNRLRDDVEDYKSMVGDILTVETSEELAIRLRDTHKAYSKLCDMKEKAKRIRLKLEQHHIEF